MRRHSFRRLWTVERRIRPPWRHTLNSEFVPDVCGGNPCTSRKAISDTRYWDLKRSPSAATSNDKWLDRAIKSCDLNYVASTVIFIIPILKHILFISSKLTLKISNLPNLWASKHVMNTKAVLFLRLINPVALFWHNFMIPRRQLVSQNGKFLLYFLTKVPKYWLFEEFGYFWRK